MGILQKGIKEKIQVHVEALFTLSSSLLDLKE